MKLFGKKISIGKTIKDIGKGIVKGVSTAVNVVAPVIKTVFPATAGIVDKASSFLGKVSTKTQNVTNVITSDPVVSNAVQSYQHHNENVFDTSDSVSGGNTGGSNRNSSTSKNSFKSTSDSDDDGTDTQFAIKMGPMPKLALIFFGLWKLFGGSK